MANSHPLEKIRKILKNFDKSISDYDYLYTGSIRIDALNTDGIDWNPPRNYKKSQVYIKFIKDNIRSEFISSESTIMAKYSRIISLEMKSQYAYGILEEIREIDRDIVASDKENLVYLNYAKIRLDELMNRMTSEFENELLFLENRLQRKNEKGKLRFNLKRTELLHLMIYMRDEGIISKDYKPYSLGLYIDNNFRYYNGRQKRFMDFVDSKKSIEKIDDQSQFSKAAVKSISNSFSGIKKHFENKYGCKIQ